MRVGDDGHIQTVSDYLGLTEFYRLRGNLSVHGVEKLVLEEQDRVVVTDRRPEKMVGIRRVGRGNELQTCAV